jgi:Protein kinase domain
VGETTPLVKLLDFGLARDVTPDAAGSRQAATENGRIFGSPAYLSPEQAAGEPADARSDLYSLGVVLFEMLCGRPPFVRAELLEVVNDHRVTPPPSPRAFTPELSVELEAAILKVLAKDPAGRFQTAEELQSALASCPEWAVSGAPELGWSSQIQLIAPPPVAEVAPPPVAEAVPMETPLAADASVANLRPTRWRSLLVAVVVLLVAAGVTRAVTRHRFASAGPMPVESAAAVQPPESKLSVAGRRHLSVAQDYGRKFWCTAAIDELEEGLREDPELRFEPQLTRTVIPCLRTKTQEKTMQFLVRVVGREAKPELESALSEDLKPDVRDGVQRTLARLANRP